MLSAFLLSTLVVAIAEIGDKTQLLSLLLAARFRAPLPIISGILLATLANHALAGLLGEWLGAQLGPDILRWTLGVSLLGIAVWTLRPDRLDDGLRPMGRHGVLLITFALFFVAEIGDKTQVATVVLAAQYPFLAAVVAGTTLGMMIANVPAVLAGSTMAGRLPLRAIRTAAAMLFAALGVLALAGVGL